MRERPVKVPPPWFRCAGCGKNRAGHDAAEARVPQQSRHDFVSVTTHMNRRNREQAQSPLIDNN